MEDIFSSKSSEIIQKKLELNDHHAAESNHLDLDLDSYFDLPLITTWIAKNSFRRIALQFPDELLDSSVKICNRLKALNDKDRLFFILADTSYGNCCVDLVAAEHNNADSIVHFGHSCLSLVDKLPVFYVFEKHRLDLDILKKQVNEKLSEKKLIILYDVSYYHLFDLLKKTFENESTRVFISDIHFASLSQQFTGSSNTSDHSKILFSRILPNDLANDKASARNYSFLYIGAKETFLNPFLFYFNKLRFHQLNPLNGYDSIVELPFAKTNRELMKRFYLIEKAKDARIFGILIGTMSVAKYKEAIDHVGNLLKKVNRKYYLFLIGKLNCPKLNNFLEVDMYVMVSCNENCLINSKELNKPIITIYELEMAFNSARLWGNEYVCDFRQLLPNSEHYLPLETNSDELNVSLITGGVRLTAINKELKESADEVNALMSRNDNLSVLHHSGAGEHLQNRSWTGLEQNLGKTEVTKAIDGRKGIAANYNSEPPLK